MSLHLGALGMSMNPLPAYQDTRTKGSFSLPHESWDRYKTAAGRGRFSSSVDGASADMIPHELSSSDPAQCLARARYLAQFDAQHPQELLCFACGQFRIRKQPRKVFTRDSYKPRCPGTHYNVIYGCSIDDRLTQTFSHSNEKGYILYKWPNFYEVMRGSRLGAKYGTPYLLNSSHTGSGCDDTRAIAVYDRLLIRGRLVRGITPDISVE